MIDFKLPSLGADMDEGKLLKWLVEPGQSVKKGDIVAVVDTSKAAVDIEVWFDATVHELLTAVGETIPVGTTMARLREPGEAAPAAASEATAPRKAAVTAGPAPAPAAKAAVRPASTDKSAAAPAPSGAPGAAKGAVSPVAAKEPASPVTTPPAAAPHGAQRPASAGPHVTPAAGQRAAELGVSLAGLVGSGEGGAITRADVERAASGGEAPARAGAAPESIVGGRPAAAPAQATARAESDATGGGAAAAAGERASQMRKVIAAAMARSKREIPHYYLTEPVPMRAALDWLGQANAKRPVTGRMLPAVLQLKAVALALREFPELNGLFVDGRHAPSEAVHVGVAISLRQGGLVAPALHDVATKDLDTVMRELADLVRRCRAFSLRSSEMADPTVTVTNLGDQGVESVLGVIYPPQVALVGFGRIADRAWVEGGRVVAMPVTVASLAADHRASDGHRGALFLARLRELLQHPESL